MKPSWRRWLAALGALLAGGAVSGALLVAADPDRQSIDVYAAAVDVPKGGSLSSDVLRLTRVRVDDSAQLFTPGDEGKLAAMLAAHDLAEGQLIQRGDATEAGARSDLRLVFVAAKNVPPAPPGSRVDLLVIRNGGDRTSVSPFALGVEVQATVAGGLIVVVPSRQASALVYAAATMELVAVIAESGGTDGGEVPVSSPDEAFTVASQ